MLNSVSIKDLLLKEVKAKTIGTVKIRGKEILQT